MNYIFADLYVGRGGRVRRRSRWDDVRCELASGRRRL